MLYDIKKDCKYICERGEEIFRWVFGFASKLPQRHFGNSIHAADDPW